MEYTLIRSARRTLALEVRPEGLVVRAPYRAKQSDIEGFIEKHREWIEKRTRLMRARTAPGAGEPPITPAELDALAKQARKVIPQRVEYYAPIAGVTYGRIAIRRQRSKWGSCSSKGNLNFNCLLMLAPPEVLDSVVVHELCHRKHMDHSREFYSEVERVFPEYRRWNAWLKKNGPALMARMRAGENEGN